MRSARLTVTYQCVGARARATSSGPLPPGTASKRKAPRPGLAGSGTKAPASSPPLSHGRTLRDDDARSCACLARASAAGSFRVFAVDVTDLEELELETMERMDKALDKLGENLMTVRTGRASPALLEGVQVDYYGAPTPIKSLATITVQDGATIVVQPFDKSSLGEIEKAVRESDLGLSPNNDGNLVRINVPQLTAERRKDMVKVVSKYGEETKVAIRNIRRDVKKTLDKYQKDGLSEDLCKDKESDLQSMTDDFVKKTDEAVKAKEKEITTV